MQHISEHIQGLIQKYFDGTIGPEETKELDAWYSSLSPENIELEPGDTENEVRLRVRHRLEQLIQKDRRVMQSSSRFLLRAAAIFVLCLSAAIFYFFSSSRSVVNNSSLVAEAPNDEIVPGGNKAILTLADGSAITLDNAGNGNLGQQGDTKIIKTGDGRLEYEDKDMDIATGNTAYNMVTTPRGGQYQVELADGTNVWLNASSSIRFPVTFEDSVREVEVTGEVYFEVAKNAAKPFRVKVKESYINVLGTHFNVMAYDNEESIHTTLLEGSVRVTNGAYSQSMKTGEKAVMYPSGLTTINKEDSPEDAIAWVTGKFLFHSADIHNIMRQIERWYDVDVSFEKEISLHFTGELKRSENVMTLLRKLELTGEIHFKIEKKKIAVLPK